LPESLEVLLVEDPRNANRPYFVKPEDLLDPWGVPYQYDPAGTNHRGLHADVFTERNGKIIGNWMDKI
jgi:hypothetical protein